MYFERMIDGLKTGVNRSHPANQFWRNCLPEARLFRFEERSLNNIPYVSIQTLDKDHDKPDISLPFPVCAFESADENPLLIIDGCTIHAMMAAEIAPGQVVAIMDPGSGDNRKLAEVLTMKAFQNYKMSLSPTGEMTMNIEDDTLAWMKHIFNVIVQPVLARLQNGRIFQSTEKLTYRLRGEGKGVYKIKNIIYVGRRTQKEHHLKSGKTIAYSHHFEVRGHWRKLNNEDTIGKNRAGARVVRGYTWVNEFTKGDADLPLVKKQRICTLEEFHATKQIVLTGDGGADGVLLQPDGSRPIGGEAGPTSE